MHACLVLNGNECKRHDHGIMMMKISASQRAFVRSEARKGRMEEEETLEALRPAMLKEKSELMITVETDHKSLLTSFLDSSEHQSVCSHSSDS